MRTESISPPVDIALVLVCEKCGSRLARKDEDNVSRRLASRLKKKCKEAFGKKAVRTVLTSCLDVCPEDRVTVAIVPTAGNGAAAQFFEVDVRDVEEAGDLLVKTVRRGRPVP
jgi:predicted metal-binding protein